MTKPWERYQGGSATGAGEGEAGEAGEARGKGQEVRGKPWEKYGAGEREPARRGTEDAEGGKGQEASAKPWEKYGAGEAARRDAEGAEGEDEISTGKNVRNAFLQGAGQTFGGAIQFASRILDDSGASEAVNNLVDNLRNLYGGALKAGHDLFNPDAAEKRALQTGSITPGRKLAMPEGEENPVFKIGEATIKGVGTFYPLNPELRDSLLLTQVPQGMGTMAGMAATGPFALVVGFGMEGEDAYVREIERQKKAKETLDPDKAMQKALGYAAGATAIEAHLGVGRVLKKFKKAFGPDEAVELGKRIAKEGFNKQSFRKFARERAKDIGAGFAEEGWQRYLQDVIIDGTPDAAGVIQEAVVGGIVQGLTGASVDMLGTANRKLKGAPVGPQARTGAKPDAERGIQAPPQSGQTHPIANVDRPLARPLSPEEEFKKYNQELEAQGRALGKPERANLPALEEVVKESIKIQAAPEQVKPGADTVVFGTKGQEFAAKYAVIPRALIEPSHKGDALAENPNYPLTNTRDYSSAAEQEKLLDVRNNFRPELHITDSPSAAVGPAMVAKITNEDGQSVFAVLGGNTRQMAIGAMGADKQADLYNYTTSRGERFGVLPQDPADELVRYMGEFDLRKAGERERVQKIVDALNPAPGKVQNIAEMASVDALNNVPMDKLAGLTMDVEPAAAQQVMAELIRDGHVDRNLRSQIAENAPQSAEYVKRLMINAAYQSPEIADFHAGGGRANATTTGLIEAATPSLIRMRQKGMGTMADSFAKGMSTIVNHYQKTKNLGQALRFGAGQMEMDPKFAVVNDIAEKLAGMVETNAKGGIKSDETIANFDAFFGGIERAVKVWEAEPNLFGEMSTPEDAVRGALAMWEKMNQPETGGMVKEDKAGYEKEKITIANTKVLGKWTTDEELYKSVKDYGRKNLAGKTIHNDMLDIDIAIPWQGIKKATQKADEIKLKMLPAIPDLIRKSTRYTIEQDNRSRNTIAGVLHLKKMVYVDGSVYDADIVVRKTATGHYYYDHNHSEIKKLENLPGEAVKHSLQDNMVPSSETSIPDSLAEGKQNYGATYPESDWTPAEISQRVGVEFTRVNAGDAKAVATFIPGDKPVQLSAQEQKQIQQAHDAILEHNYKVDESPDDYDFDIYDEGEIPYFNRRGEFAPSRERVYNIKFIEELDKINPELSTRLIENAFEPAQPQTPETLRMAENLVYSGDDIKGSVGIVKEAPADKQILDKIRAKIDNIENLNRLLQNEGIARSIEFLTNSQAGYISKFSTVESLRNRINEARLQAGRRVDAPAAPGAPAQGIVREDKADYVTRSRRARFLLKRIQNKEATQEEIQEHTRLEAELGQQFMSFVRDAVAPLKDFSKEEQTFFSLFDIKNPARRKAAAEYVRQIHAERAKQQQGTSTVYPIAGRDTISTGLRGSTSVTGPATGMAKRVQGADDRRQAGISDQLERVGIFFTDPAYYAPEIAGMLDHVSRISSIVPDVIAGQIPGFEFAGKIVKDTSDWAILNLTLRTPYAETMKIGVADDAGRLVYTEILSMGMEDRALVSPQMIERALNKAAARDPKAKNIFLAHNHPSGDPKPSDADIVIHRQLQEVIAENGYTLKDNVITDGERFYSAMQNKYIQFPEPRLAPWEKVQRSALKKVSYIDRFEAMASAMKNDSPGIYVFYMNTSGQLSGIEKIAPTNNIVELAQRISKSAAVEGSRSVMVSFPFEATVHTKALDTLLAHKYMLDLYDTWDPTVGSLVKAGLHTPPKPGARADDAASVHEDKPVYKAVGDAEVNTPIAIRINTKGAKPGEWIKQQLGGLEVIKPLQMPELVKLARRMTGDLPRLGKLPKSQGYFKGAKGKGAEIVLDRRIFKDPRLAAQVLSHEIGHADDYYPDETLKRGNLIGRLRSLKSYMKNTFGSETVTNKELREELIALTKWWKPWNEASASAYYNQYRKSSVELYADAVSVLLTAPAELQTRAPRFFHQILKHMDTKPEVKINFLELWDFVNQPEMQVLNQRSYEIKDMFAKGEEILLRKAKDRELRHNVFAGWQDRLKVQYSNIFYHGVKKAQAVKAAGKKLSWDQDPETLLDEHPLGMNLNYRFLHSTYKKIVEPLEARGITQDMVGEYMFLNRILNERYDIDGELSGRAVIANSKGITPDQARKQLLKMRLEMGMEDMTVLEAAVKSFQDQVFEVVKDAVNAGVYNKENFEKNLEPNKYNYATFATLDGLENNPHIPAGIRQQVGTLRDVANPFHATIIKTQALIRLIQHNKAKSAMLDILFRDLGEANKARLNWSGKGFDPVPAPEGKELMMRLVDGKPDFFYVAPEIKEMFDGLTPAHQDAILGVMGKVFRDFFYPLWIKFNANFNLYTNPIRDFRRTHRNLPAEVGGPVKSGLKLLKEYRRSYRSAVRRLKGEADPVIAEMLENFAIGSPYDSFTSNATGSPYFTKMLQDMHVLPPAEQNAFLQNKFVRPVVGMLEKLEFGGGILESIPKIAAYKILTRDLGWHPRDAAMYARNHEGTPNYLKKGQKASGGGILFPFYNIFIRGWGSDLSVMRNPKTRGGWWMKWAATNGMWTVLKIMGSVGLLGAGIKKLYDGVSEHNKTNFDIVPLGTQFEGEFGKKVLAFRIPKDETSRLLDGLLYKIGVALLGDDPQTAWQKFTSVASYAGGQVPGVNPLYSMAENWGYFLAGANPMDYFRGRPILSNDEYLAGGWPAVKAMLGWTYNQTGLNNLIRYNPHAETTTEIVLSSTPVVNSMMVLTDAGFREIQKAEDRALDRNRAELRLLLPAEVQQALREYNRLKAINKERKTAAQEERYQELNDWHSAVFKPEFEAMLDAKERGDTKTVKRIAKSIEVF